MQVMTKTCETILLVEDDLSLQGSLCQFLGDHGYPTVAAGTARSAWELIQLHRPRLCLLDLNLPDGSGLDLLRRICELPTPTRVVVMTAFDLKHQRPAGAERVLARWLTKPVNPDELLQIIVRECGAGPNGGPE
jgi:two-component system, NtrC family, response regulator HydG